MIRVGNERNIEGSLGNNVGDGWYVRSSRRIDEPRGRCGTDEDNCGAVASRVPGAEGERRGK